ncbi:3-hydroxybutyryl-CoA dehydrogenase [Streptomyces sp. NBC_01622]|uniref:3-hydroxybutyryl-CoA dehydrogenase n=1 Tax=Streptomyces sp. NBC_01622 TaxID=2975903 RepID=UPI0038693E02|nr:3-hydroxybutyryl-CoA dehydrogenase [Streptomyces sp. NBC_01622]
MERFARVGVVGAGLMGSGIAEVCARAGLEVRVVELNDAVLGHGRSRIEASMARAVRKGKLSEKDASASLARLSFGTGLAELADRDIVIEAIAEDETSKIELFAKLDAVLERQDAILASNTSSIPVAKLAVATSRPAYVIGIHFFNPVPVLPLVELIPTLLTGENTTARAEAFAVEQLGKTAIRCVDRAGFVVNALLIPYLLSAVRMLESGLATADDIDNGMVLGCAHPMGPLRLADLIGLDTVKAVAESMYQEFKEPLWSAPPLLSRMVDAGLLGVKTSRGFHQYERSSTADPAVQHSGTQL